MTVEDLVNIYNSATAVNYGVQFIDEQLECLEEFNASQAKNKQEEFMLLNLIFAALKYYLDSSPEGFEENILDLVFRIEDMYNIEGLLDCIIDIDEI